MQIGWKEEQKVCERACLSSLMEINKKIEEGFGRKLVRKATESPIQCLIHAYQGHNVTVMKFVLGQEPSRTYPTVQT